MSNFDVGMLLGAQPVRLPDPVEQYSKALTLADLARVGRVNAIKEDELRRGVDASRAFESALPDLVRAGFSDDAVASAVTANPKAGQAILKERDARAKARLEDDKSRAETENKRMDTRREQLKVLGGVANAALASGDPQMLRAAYQITRSMGVDPDQFGDVRADPMSWAKAVQAASIDAAKQIELAGQEATRTETKRHNEQLEANTVRGQDMTAETAREGQRVTMRGQNMTDARMRDANDVARTGAIGKGTTDLRKEFNDLPEVKSFKTVIPVLKSVQNAPDTTAGDLDFIYGVGKILDPTSVVREGEMNLVIKSGSPIERALGAMGYVVGRGRLTPAMRAKLVGMLEGRVGEIESQYNAARQTYERAADSTGLPKDQIFTEMPQVTRTGGQPGGLKRAADGSLTYGY